MTKDIDEEISAIELVLSNICRNIPKTKIVINHDGKDIGEFTLRNFESAVLINGGTLYAQFGGYDGKYFTDGMFATTK